jgi:hypothetical protein
MSYVNVKQSFVHYFLTSAIIPWNQDTLPWCAHKESPKGHQKRRIDGGINRKEKNKKSWRSRCRGRMNLGSFLTYIHAYKIRTHTQTHTHTHTYIYIYIHEGRPQSKFPWRRFQKQNTISRKYLLQQIQQLFSYFSTYSPPELRHLSYRGTKLCRPVS